MSKRVAFLRNAIGLIAAGQRHSGVRAVSSRRARLHPFHLTFFGGSPAVYGREEADPVLGPAVKGGHVPDISRLQAGNFYAALEGTAFHKITAPWCLSHHPHSPLTTEEVLELARRPLGPKP
jgi:hypothetical protein